MPSHLSQQNFNRIPVLGFVPESSPSPPGNPVDGLIYYDTAAKKLKAYQNGAWVALDTDTNTTYQSGTSALINAGTDGNDRVWSAAQLKAGIQGLIPAAPVTSVAGKTGAVTLVKGDVGLGSVDNTSDASKPVSTAQQTALNLKANNANPTFTGSVTVPAPTAATDAANKQYVDTAIQGLEGKESVRAASVGDLTLSGAQTVDGVALVAGNRVLVKNQTAAPGTEGIYIVQTGAWTRAADADTPAELVAAFVFVEEGTVNGDTGWLNNSNGGVSSFNNTRTWTQFSSAGNPTAGAGLTKTGNVFSISNKGVTAAMMGDNSVDLASAAPTGVLPLAKGGTGSNSLATLRTALDIPVSRMIALPELQPGAWTVVPGLTLPVGHSGAYQLRAIDNLNNYEEVTLDNRFNYINSQIQVRSDVLTNTGDISVAVTYSPVA